MSASPAIAFRRLARLDGALATKTIDANGLALTPGFIDVHSHAGGGLATDELKHGQPVLAQGITTVLVNPDGGGPDRSRGAASALRASKALVSTSA